MILFITRKFPPSIGGMQRASHKLASHIQRMAPVSLVAWGGSQTLLPFIMIWFLMRSMSILIRGGVAVVYLGDPVLSPLGLVLRALFGIPVVVTVHGRDIVFGNRVYQAVLPRILARLDRIVCVSSALRKECLRRGVPAERCVVIPDGVDVQDFEAAPSRKEVERATKRLGRMLDETKVLLTVGRLVAKKGILYFIAEILPKVLSRREDIHYVVLGEGPLRSRIEHLCRENKLTPHVTLLGEIPMEDDLLRTLYHLAALFIMPNIPVEGDMEGFGIVALEAAASGTWTVATEVDGIPEAVSEGVSGNLIRVGDSQAFADTICRLLDDEERMRQLGYQAKNHVRENYSWARISGLYLELFRRVMGEHSADDKGKDPHESARITSEDYDAEYYDLLATWYENGTIWSRDRVSNILSLVEPRPQELILDLGCGVGVVAIECARLGARVIGVDYSELAVKKGEQLVARQGVDSVAFVVARSERIPMTTESFDKIIAADLIEHLYPDEYEATIKECYRLLKPTGLLLIYSPAPGHFFELAHRLGRHLGLASQYDRLHVHIRDMRCVVSTLQNAGFSIEKNYFAPSHVPILKQIETALMHIPFLGGLFRRRICVRAGKVIVG